MIMKRTNITAGFIGGAVGATIGAIGTLSAIAIADKRIRRDFVHRFEDLVDQGEKFFNRFAQQPQRATNGNGKRKLTLKPVRRTRKRAE